MSYRKVAIIGFVVGVLDALVLFLVVMSIYGDSLYGNSAFENLLIIQFWTLITLPGLYAGLYLAQYGSHLQYLGFVVNGLVHALVFIFLLIILRLLANYCISRRTDSNDLLDG